MAKLKIADLKTQSEVVGRELARDEDFARDWERLSLARAVSAKVIAYRSDNDLSQRDLARQLGVSQPQVARLESGEHEPAYATLIRLASALDMEFTISITPADREPALLTRRARDAESARYTSGRAIVRLTAV
jgi:transcriptional regulator with XRE-family HTH domain